MRGRVFFLPPGFRREAGHGALIYRKAKRGCYVVRASMAFRQGAEGDPGLSGAKEEVPEAPRRFFPTARRKKSSEGVSPAAKKS